MASIKIVLRKNMIRKDGRIPLAVRIIKLITSGSDNMFLRKIGITMLEWLRKVIQTRNSSTFF